MKEILYERLDSLFENLDNQNMENDGRDLKIINEVKKTREKKVKVTE